MIAHRQSAAEYIAVDRQLLDRCLWLAGQVQRLHELSFDMGVCSSIADGPSMPGHILAGQTIIEGACKLECDLARAIGVHL